MTVRDLTRGGINEGDRFCHLVTVRAERQVYGRRGWTRWSWLCRCDCGQEIWVPVGNLQTGNSKSCGCTKPERIRIARTTHGQSNQRSTGRPATREYNSWTSMIARCLNTTNHKYPDYGGRGITVCRRWIDSFEAFYADMGPRPPNTTLDRFPNNATGNYEPGNCRWATPLEQRLNQRPRRPNRTYCGRPIEGRAS